MDSYGYLKQTITQMYLKDKYINNKKRRNKLSELPGIAKLSSVGSFPFFLFVVVSP